MANAMTKIVFLSHTGDLFIPKQERGFDIDVS